MKPPGGRPPRSPCGDRPVEIRVGERLKEGDDVSLFLRAHVVHAPESPREPRHTLGVAAAPRHHVRIPRPPLVVELQHVLERGHRPVVHVGGGQRHVAQRRRAKPESARPGVGLLQPPDLLGGQCRRVACLVAVERAVHGNERPFEPGDGAADLRGVDHRILTEGLAEPRHVLRDRLQALDHGIERCVLVVGPAAHLLECLERLERLALEAPDAAIPQHRCALLVDRRDGTVEHTPSAAPPPPPLYAVERGVQDSRGVAPDDRNLPAGPVDAGGAEAHAARAEREFATVRVREVRMMTGGASDVAIA